MFDFLKLPERTTKPRATGLTHVLDRGYSLEQVRQFMSMTEWLVDVVKLGWGSAVVTPNMPIAEVERPVHLGTTVTADTLGRTWSAVSWRP